MFWLIFNIIFLIALIVFLLMTVRILFVFITRLSKNHVLNKSVAKNVFSGKLSLVIILLFYGVSFGLIGGANLMSKNGQRSIEQQFREGNLYQIEMETSELTKNDEFFSLEAQLYNKQQTDENQKIANTEFVNPEIVKGTIKDPKATGFAGFTNVAGDLVALDLLDEYDTSKYEYCIGWTKKEWETQLYTELVEETSTDYAINDYLGGGTTFADTIIKYGFGNSVSNYGNALYLVKTLNQVDDVSYKVSLYENITPRLSLSSNKDFEVSIINDIDFLTGKSLSETSDENNRFKHGEEVNKTKYLTSSNDQEFYSESYFANDRNFNALNQEFSINVQEDYLNANGLKENDNINFSNATKFKVSNPIRFTEVTYPLMGTNFLVDEKQQGFIQMNLSDFLLFATSNTYDSTFKNSGFRTYVSLDNSKVNSINDWMGNNNKLIDLQRGFINKLKSINSEPINSEPIKIGADLFEQKINEFKKNDLYSDFMDEIISSKYYFDSKGNFIDYAYYYGCTNLISEMGSFESIRALLGPIEISSTQNMLNILTLIFMVVVLIVISMLINKRINDSGKQIGTLKAMGMSNKDISASYVIFPMVLIFMGFAVASLVSPIVMLLFTKLMSSYYYVSFAANPLSISFFVLLLFVPAILSIGLTYIISQIILRKPTLDLLSNKGKDSPNILVRAAGYVTPKWVPFQASYMGKGLLRAVGKSFMLFISIFLSTLLTAFAMSSTTMIEHQTNSALSYLNFDSFEYASTSNYGQIDYQDMFVYDDTNGDGEWEVVYKDYLIGPDADGAKKDYEEMIKVVIPEAINILDGTNTEQAFTNIYNETTKIVFEDLQKKLDENVLVVDPNLKISSEFVISKYQMEEVAFTQLSLQYLYNSLAFDTTGNSFYEWEKQDDPITYFKLKPFTENWLTSLTMNFVKSGKNFETLIKTTESRNSFTDIIDSFTDVINNLIHNIENKFSIVRNFESDLSFGTKYVNQFNQLFMSTSVVSQEGFAINSENYVETKKKEDQDTSYKTDIYLNIMKDKQDFKNAYGSTSEISDELWEKMEPYYEDIKSEGTLDAVPVIVTTQTLKQLEDSKDFKNLGDNTYEVAASYHALSNSEPPETFHSYDSIKLKIKIKVVGTIFVGINFGMNTIDDFMEYYLNTHINDMYYNSPANSFTKETNGDYKITYPNGYTKFITAEEDTPSSEVFYQSQNQGFNIINYKYAKEEKPHHLQKENTTTSLALSTSETTKLFDDGKSDLTFKDYLDPSNSYTSNTKLMNGLPVKVDMLLAQAAKAYEMIIAMFMIISFFAIFMSTTIIIIAVKDVIDSSKREVSMLKAFGYSSLKSTILIMMPYVFVALFAFVIALPMTFLGLGIIASVLTTITGNIFTFTLTAAQWIVLTIYVIGLVLLLGLLGYISFRRTNALEAIKATDE